MRLFSLPALAGIIAAAFVALSGGLAAANPPPTPVATNPSLTPSGDIYGIRFVKDSFQVKQCVGGSAAVDFAFVSTGETGTVVATVLQGGSTITRSQLVKVDKDTTAVTADGRTTTVTDFVIPQGLEGDMVFRIESAAHSAPLYKQSAMNTATRYVAQAKCTLAESSNTPKEPVDTSADNNGPAYPSWLKWALVGAGACVLIAIGVAATTIRSNRWQK